MPSLILTQPMINGFAPPQLDAWLDALQAKQHWAITWQPLLNLREDPSLATQLADLCPADQAQIDGYTPIALQDTGLASEFTGMRCKAQNVGGSGIPPRLCNAADRPGKRSRTSILKGDGYTPTLTVFISPAALRIARPYLPNPWPEAWWTGVMGLGSKEQAIALGIPGENVIAPEAQHGESEDARGLIQAIKRHLGWAPNETLPSDTQDLPLDSAPSPPPWQRYCLIHGNPARPWLAQQLAWFAAQRGDQPCLLVKAYDRCPVVPTNLAACTTPESYWYISSSAAVKVLGEALRDQPAARGNITLLLSHPQIDAPAELAGFPRRMVIGAGLRGLLAYQDGQRSAEEGLREAGI